jgi:hypothetical protein
MQNEPLPRRLTSRDVESERIRWHSRRASRDELNCFRG